ncbi:MAG TPA: hypothetical protein VIT00_04655 [Terrimicrobiaceae bacterium]
MCRFPCPVLFPSSIAAKLDLALGEIGVSADRERRVDFTQPFLVTTMAVAVLKDTSFANWRQILYGITHHGLIPVVLGMMGLLLIFSVLLWLLERRNHAGSLRRKANQGSGIGAVVLGCHHDNCRLWR